MNKVILIAVVLLINSGFIFGQDVNARSFRDESKIKYDSKAYFNLVFLFHTDGKLVQTDSVHVFIRERDSTRALGFIVAEKAELYFAYDRFYIIDLSIKGYPTLCLVVNSGVKKKKYGMSIPVYFTKGEKNNSIGIVVWDSRIDNIHYYPEPHGCY